MNSIFRNQEFKSIILKLIILQLIFALTGFFVIQMVMNNINQRIIERDMTLVGNILYAHPDLEEEIIPYITKEIPQENKEKGQAVLKEYGYRLQTSKDDQPLLTNIIPGFQWSIAFLILLFFIPLALIIIGEYKKLYGKVTDISNAAEKVVEGDFTVYLHEGGEGDFNILYHQFNQMTNRLEHSLDVLQKEKVFLKDSLSDISHQLKTPLSSLIMLNDILLEDKNIDYATQITFLEKSQSQLYRMEWLIINLLKIARIEAGAIEFKREKVLLKEVVDIAINALSTQIKHQSLEIVGNRQSYFYGDKNWTGEALINILKNSIEHGGEKIQILLEDTPLFTSITVKDNGEGIDPKHFPHIFKKFYRVDSEVKPESIGIGLNLAKIIVESQEGTLSVKSQKALGTEMTMTFLKGGKRH
ncbi:HAMP domain-containing histidine kinase [Irregularibacter muris]|uniref:histidine kinase n=1 Tax=Irregularibacter muris TaxID=1796619 RepID=A0AAE3HI16_9FIRM|nr:HAMP domain-containing sensor histidine kinase [Irregularibacter muris]MCR1899503.1 HAMP domain-containing histidine kinase [Irregularibacter muris]